MEFFADLRAALGETVTAPQLSKALQRYCNGLAYLKRVKEGAPRIDLNGREDGRVTADQARRAKGMRYWLSARRR